MISSYNILLNHVLKKISSYFVNHENQTKISINDTPGLFDSDGDDNKINNDMKKYLIKSDIPRINTILIVISIRENRME